MTNAMAKALAVVMTMRSQREKMASGPEIHITRRRGAVAGTRRTRQRRARYDNSRHPMNAIAARTSALRIAVTSPNSASLIHFGGVVVGARARASATIARFTTTSAEATRSAVARYTGVRTGVGNSWRLPATYRRNGSNE